MDTAGVLGDQHFWAIILFINVRFDNQMEILKSGFYLKGTCVPYTVSHSEKILCSIKVTFFIQINSMVYDDQAHCTISSQSYPRMGTISAIYQLHRLELIHGENKPIGLLTENDSHKCLLVDKVISKPRPLEHSETRLRRLGTVCQ